MFFRFVGGRRKAIDLDNVYSGSVFFCGGGPHLRENAAKLANANIVTAAMNNAGTVITPKLWFGADDADYYSDSILMNPNILKFMYITRSDSKVRGIPAEDLPMMFYTTGLADYPEKDFFARGRDFVWWKNVFLWAMQILHRLGFSRVYTVGCGFKIDTKDPYAWKNPNMTPEMVKYNQETYSCVVRQLRGVMPTAKEAHFELISCTPDSALNEFVRYRDLDEVLAEESAKVPPHDVSRCKHPLSSDTAPKRWGPEKEPKVTVLMPTFKRTELLQYGIKSLAVQTVPKGCNGFETLVLDESSEKDGGELLKTVLNSGGVVINTGTGKPEGVKWRVPGYAFNIGCKKAKGNILVLTCPEIYHLSGLCLDELVAPVIEDKLNVGLPEFVYDDNASVLDALKAGQPTGAESQLAVLKALRRELPFFMAVHREVYEAIGGYDEDFVGRCYDDDDFTERLIAFGCKYVVTKARVVHLYHERITLEKDQDHDRVNLNKDLYMKRKGQVVRNQGREWGQLVYPKG